MNKRLSIILILLALLLASCSTDSPAPAADEAADPVEDTAVVENTAVPTPIEPTAEPEPTNTPPPPPPTEEPTAEPQPEPPVANLTDGCVTEYSEGIDYFPEKTVLTHTSSFTVEYFNNYKVVTVLTPFSGAEEPVQYVLVQCGTPVPEGFDNATTVEVPINSFVAMSTIYLPALEILGELDSLVGVDSSLFTTNETVLGMVEAGTVTEIGGGADVNVETAVDLDPDLIMTYASGFADFDAHPKLQEAGLSVALNAELLETSPLGRAEWIDFIALFYNKEATAEAWFAEMSSDYEALTAMTADITERPTVFSSTPFDGTWYMPGGNSYVAQLLADAGADYLWADDESTGTLFLDFETVFDQAAEADYWVNLGSFGSLADLAAADERYAEFAAFENGRVFNYDVRTNENGGNDYFESGVVFPNVVLADLIKIFHPELLPDHEFVYYRPLE